MLEHTLITVSRQYGSGGREVCDWLSRKLGVMYFDREILLEAAAKTGIQDANYEQLNAMSYKADRVTFGFDAFYPRDAAQVSDNAQMYIHQSAAIRTIAQKGSAIFLGRCADYVLKDFPRIYSFYTYADEAFRENRAKEKYAMTLKKLEKIDQQRRAYYRRYTGREMNTPENYHLMLNISKMTPEEAADLIIAYIEEDQK